jgi:hypothetical protein
VVVEVTWVCGCMACMHALIVGTYLHICLVGLHKPLPQSAIVVYKVVQDFPDVSKLIMVKQMAVASR